MEHTTAKASAVGAVLPRLMPSLAGPKQKGRALLSSVVTSVLTYGIPIWADALRYQEAQRTVDSIFRDSALRIISAFCTVFQLATHMIAEFIPIEVSVKERRALYQQRRQKPCIMEEAERQVRQNRTLVKSVGRLHQR